MKKIIERMFNFNVSQEKDDYEKPDEEWEKDFKYVEDFLRKNKIDMEKEVVLHFLISKYFSGEETIELFLKFKDIPLNKFKIDIFYPEGNSFEERKKCILKSFNQLIDEYILEHQNKL